MLVEAHLFARLSPEGWRNFFARIDDWLVFTPGDHKSIPLSELFLVTAPGIQSEMPRGLWNAVLAYHQHSDQSVDTRPPSGARPILVSFFMAAELKGESAGSSIIGSHHLREARAFGFDEERGSLGGPSKRTRKLVEAARAPAEIRGYMDSGGRLNILRQFDRRVACVSAGLKCWGLFCDLNMVPRFPPAELALLRWGGPFA